MFDAHKIVYVNGHYELRDEGGKFILSGDTWEECYEELTDIIEN